MKYNLDYANQSLVRSFTGVLNSICPGEAYKEQPPKGPPDNLASITNEELQNLQRTVFGEDIKNTRYSYQTIKLVEEPDMVNLELPGLDLLGDVIISGIDGSNQRVERGSFYFILARAVIVNFRYSAQNLKPYFYNVAKDASMVAWVDGNVFTEDIKLRTKELLASGDDKSNILAKINAGTDVPFLVRYNSDRNDKSPSSHALGWAVKLQQALELTCIREVKTDIKTICIKDGPLFSTSVSIPDVLEGLSPIFTWNNQVLIACSKRVKDSTLLLEMLLKNVALRDHYFKGQNINDETLKSIGTDSLILPRLLKPGQRTPLFEAVPVSRQKVVDESQGGDPRLTPLSCYYLSRHRPHTYIRVEVPKFMWEQNRKLVNEGLQIVAWQHELGHAAPLVQLAADDRCQLLYDKQILEKQTAAALIKKQLDFPEDY